MGGAHSDYKRGDMEVGAQRGTFDGFMGFTVYGGVLIALALIFAVLTVGGVSLSWLPALVITFVIGVIAGVALKLNATWYASITVLAIITSIFCVISPPLIALFAS